MQSPYMHMIHSKFMPAKIKVDFFNILYCKTQPCSLGFSA